MAQETKEQRRLRELRKTLAEAAALLRKRTGQRISAGQLGQVETVPPHSRYLVASLFEALNSDLRKLSPWILDEAERLAQAIIREDGWADQSTREESNL